MKNNTKTLISIILGSTLLFLIFYGPIYGILVINSVEETIRINNNISENSSVDIYIHKHTWKSDWYEIYYIIKTPNYVCSKREKENFPWKCEDIPYESYTEHIWFNMKTKEIHQPDIWK